MGRVPGELSAKIEREGLYPKLTATTSLRSAATLPDDAVGHRKIRVAREKADHAPDLDAPVFGVTSAETDPMQRDHHLRFIAKRGRAAWQKVFGYAKQARAEAAIGRFKQVIGDGLHSRTVSAAGNQGERRCPFP